MLDFEHRNRQFDWTTTGLAALDETAQPAVPAAWRGLSGNLFQVVAPRFEATAHTKYDSNRLTQIPLAVIHAVLHGDRRLAVTAHLTVLPTKSSNPASSDLEFHAVAGLPPTANARGRHHRAAFAFWAPLLATRVPQRCSPYRLDNCL